MCEKTLPPQLLLVLFVRHTYLQAYFFANTPDGTWTTISNATVGFQQASVHISHH